MAGLLEASVKASVIPLKAREEQLRKATKRLISDVVSRAPAQARKASRLRYLLKPKEFGKAAKIKGALPKAGQRIGGDPFAGSAIVFRTPRKSLHPSLGAMSSSRLAALNRSGGSVRVDVLRGRPGVFRIGRQMEETGHKAFTMLVRRNPANGAPLAKPVALLASRKDGGGVRAVKTISPAGSLRERSQVQPELKARLSELLRKRAAHHLSGVVK